MITEVVENLCHVRYVVDGHGEKYIPITRLTMIPMPYRRKNAQLRTRSSRTTTAELTGDSFISFKKLKFNVTLSFSSQNYKLCINIRLLETRPRICGAIETTSKTFNWEWSLSITGERAGCGTASSLKGSLLTRSMHRGRDVSKRTRLKKYS